MRPAAKDALIAHLAMHFLGLDVKKGNTAIRIALEAAFTAGEESQPGRCEVCGQELSRDGHCRTLECPRFDTTKDVERDESAEAARAFTAAKARGG